MMLSTFHFLLFVIFIFSVSVYAIMASSEIVASEYNSANKSKPKTPNSRNKVNSFTVFKYNKKSKINSVNDSSKPVDVDINLEMKKRRRQLKRDLRTLNYITLIEARPKMIRDSERLEEISNLKEGLQRQIIKNTELLNNHR